MDQGHGLTHGVPRKGRALNNVARSGGRLPAPEQTEGPSLLKQLDDGDDRARGAECLLPALRQQSKAGQGAG